MREYAVYIICYYPSLGVCLCVLLKEGNGWNSPFVPARVGVLVLKSSQVRFSRVLHLFDSFLFYYHYREQHH